MLVAVDGVPVRGFSVHEVARVLLGAEGSLVELSFQRKGTIFTTNLERRPSPKLANNQAWETVRERTKPQENSTLANITLETLHTEIQTLRSELSSHRAITSESIASIRSQLAGESPPPHLLHGAIHAATIG